MHEATARDQATAAQSADAMDHDALTTADGRVDLVDERVYGGNVVGNLDVDDGQSQRADAVCGRAIE